MLYCRIKEYTSLSAVIILRLIITGGAGFVGSHLADALLAAGHDVTVVDNLSTGRRSNVPPGAILAECDVRSRLVDLFRTVRPEVVFHLAAQVSVAESVLDPVADLTTNAVGTVNVMDAATACGARKVISMSSAAVYGVPQSLPLSENSPTRPISPYGLSKLVTEDYIRLMGTLRGIAYTIIRPANIYGPRQMSDGEGAVIPAFLERFLSRTAPTIHGTGEQTRDFVYVTDMVGALMQAMDYADGMTVNVSSAKAISVLELWTLLARMVGWTDGPVFGPVREGDIPHSLMANEAARHNLRWAPRTSLQEGLALTTTWYSQLQAAAGHENARRS